MEPNTPVQSPLSENLPSSPAPQQGAPPTPPPANRERFLPLILAVFAIITGILLFVLFQQLRKKPEQSPPITIVVTPTVSPTPIRYPTNISTSSGFLDFETSVASYSTKLSTFEKNDPSLSPPSIVLPLGFSN